MQIALQNRATKKYHYEHWHIHYSFNCAWHITKCQGEIISVLMKINHINTHDTFMMQATCIILQINYINSDSMVDLHRQRSVFAGQKQASRPIKGGFISAWRQNR